jgi:uncharacterized membrane protein
MEELMYFFAMNAGLIAVIKMVFFLVIGVLYLIVPFSIFAMKRNSDEMLRLQTRATAEAIRNQSDARMDYHEAKEAYFIGEKN